MAPETIIKTLDYATVIQTGVSQPAVTSATAEFGRFEALASTLLQVPKSASDEKLNQDSD